MESIKDDISLSNKKIKSILGDAEKSAKAIDLVYVQDSQPGILRVKKGNGFHYILGKKRLRDKATLERIKAIAIPPAWKDVWICKLSNGHLQATGFDLKCRKQYKYHPAWRALRNHTKFFRLYEFGKAIPAMRRQLKMDLSLPGLPLKKVLAAVICLMEQTSIRIGSSLYEKLYGSFGLTTLKDKHVKISGDKMQFSFVGKSGVAHSAGIKSKRLAKIVKNCRDIPGKELFQFYDQDGNRKSIDSGMVNDYLREVAGKDFTAKDFRTWAGTIQAIKAFREIGLGQEQADIKKNIMAALCRAAEHLGNTLAVCRKYYVHPAIISLYERNSLHRYLLQLDKISARSKKGDLLAEEQLLMIILKKENLA